MSDSEEDYMSEAFLAKWCDIDISLIIAHIIFFFLFKRSFSSAARHYVAAYEIPINEWPIPITDRLSLKSC